MGPAQWIDTHTHLEHEYPFTTDQYLDAARAAGVSAFVTIGTRPGTLSKLRDLAALHADVYFTVGVHPHEAKAYDDAAEREMDGLRAHAKCVAVGEIGLDYHYNHSPPETQRRVFARQLELAIAWRKPVVIHAREAEAHLLEHLGTYAAAHPLRDPADPRVGIIHCFSGSRAFAEECLGLGFYVSFSGIVTFKNADILRRIARDVPLERILLETDSPYLAPLPYRGKPNQSAYLIETAKVVAEARGLALEDLSAATVANSRRIYGLSV